MATAQALLVVSAFWSLVSQGQGADFVFGEEARRMCEAYKRICPAKKICALQSIDWPRHMKFPVCVHEKHLIVKSQICTRPPAPGRCHANFHRWYFNVHAASCSWFSYTGCGGNSNNFRTREECEQRCMTSRGSTALDKQELGIQTILTEESLEQRDVTARDDVTPAYRDVTPRLIPAPAPIAKKYNLKGDLTSSLETPDQAKIKRANRRRERRRQRRREMREKRRRERREERRRLKMLRMMDKVNKRKKSKRNRRPNSNRKPTYPPSTQSVIRIPSGGLIVPPTAIIAPPRRLQVPPTYKPTYKEFRTLDSDDQPLKASIRTKVRPSYRQLTRVELGPSYNRTTADRMTSPDLAPVVQAQINKSRRPWHMDSRFRRKRRRRVRRPRRQRIFGSRRPRPSSQPTKRRETTAYYDKLQLFELLEKKH